MAREFRGESRLRVLVVTRDHRRFEPRDRCRSESAPTRRDNGGQRAEADFRRAAPAPTEPTVRRNDGKFVFRFGSGFPASAFLVQRGDTAAQRLHVFPDLLVLGLRFLVRLAHARQLQIRLQVFQRSGDVVQLIGQEAAIAQLAQG